MRAFEIAEFDELVVDEAGVAVGDEQMAFTGSDGELREELGGGGPGGDYDCACG